MGGCQKGISGFPKKKKKGKCRDSFYVSNDHAHITNNHVTLPLVGKVRLAEQLKFKKKKSKIMSFSVSRTAGHWFVSVNFEMDDALLIKQSGNGIIGVDVGLKAFAVTSNNDNHIAPKPMKKHLKKLKREQRRLSRKKKRSCNRFKARKKVAKLHARIANIRRDFLHKLSHDICKKNRIIVAEDLNVQDMLKNHKLALHISDASWGEFNRQLEYKAKRTNSIFIKADRWFASTKTCSGCGHVKDHIGLDEREFICEHCGMKKDRDLNAAINLLAWGLFNLLDISGASGEFTPVEIVALVQRLIAELTTVTEASCDSSSSASAEQFALHDNQSLCGWLRNKVELQNSIKEGVKNGNTFLHSS